MSCKSSTEWMRSVLAETMSGEAKTEAIVVWDIENNRVPTQLIPRCFEIVQWLLQDVQKNWPHSTVLRVYVAGTFDKYPSQLKNALCTHPRVQLLYSIGKVTLAPYMHMLKFWASVCTWHRLKCVFMTADSERRRSRRCSEKSDAGLPHNSACSKKASTDCLAVRQVPDNFLFQNECLKSIPERHTMTLAHYDGIISVYAKAVGPRCRNQMSTTPVKGCLPACIKQLKHRLLPAAGDADYNDVVDAARIAGHKVHLYHSHSVAQTLQGNVDHHEAWHAFLARKSGESVEDLEDTGYMVRGASPIASKSSGVPRCTAHQAWMGACVPHHVSHSTCAFRFLPLVCIWCPSTGLYLSRWLAFGVIQRACTLADGLHLELCKRLVP